MGDHASPWILLTGAAGFVGRHVARCLRDGGHRVAGLLRESAERPAAGDACEFWLRPSELAGATGAGPLQAVVHLATAYGHDGRLAEVVESNLFLPARLLDLCRTAGCTQFISTDTFFGKPQFSYPHLQAYIRSKRELLEWAQLACATDPQLRYSSLRLEHVYGEGDGPRKFVPDLIARLQRGQPQIELTAGDQLRDFIHVEDVARAYACVLGEGLRLPAGVTEYQVGTGSAIPLRRFVETAHRLTASSSHLNFGALPHRPGEIMASAADTRRLAALGWQPATALEDGLLRTAAASLSGTSQ